MSSYRRVLLKLSGEALAGEQGFGFCPDTLNQLADDIRDLQQDGVELGLVIGGGNFMRGANLAKAGIHRASADSVGMLATMMNAVAVRDVLQNKGLRVAVFTPSAVAGVSSTFRHDVAKTELADGTVAIFAGGTGNPFFTTDTAACLRAIEIDADIVIKATGVDGVYDKDPKIHDDAVLLPQLTYQQVLDQRLAVMDMTAILLCQDFSMPIGVANMAKPGAMKQAILSQAVGTLIGGV
jgi:uridylate kinase